MGNATRSPEIGSRSHAEDIVTRKMGYERSVGRQRLRSATRMLTAKRRLCLGEAGQLFDLRGVDKIDFMRLGGEFREGVRR